MIASIISFGFGTFGDPDHIVTHGFVSGIGGGGWQKGLIERGRRILIETNDSTKR